MIILWWLGFGVSSPGRSRNARYWGSSLRVALISMPSKYGESIAFDMQPLALGSWHTVQTMVQLNQAGRHNGVVKTWLNGKLVLNQQNMRFRNNNKLEIDHFLFASFFGGSGPDWAPQQDSYAYIDDIRISQRPVFF